MNDGCPGCGRRQVGICPDCEILARTEVTVSRAAWPTWLAMAAIVLLLGLIVLVAYEVEFLVVRVRVIFYGAFPIAALLAWVRSSSQAGAGSGPCRVFADD